MSSTANTIMDAAERRIRDVGYAGFSFRDIAAEVGLKSASIHHHFPTKEDLAAAVARRYRERFMAALDQAIGDGGDVTAAWHQAFRQGLLNDGKMCLCGALGATAGNLPEAVLMEARRFFEVSLDRLGKNGFTPAQAKALIALLEGAMLLANVLSDPQAFNQATASLM